MLYLETRGKAMETTIELKFRGRGQLSSVLTFFANFISQILCGFSVLGDCKML